ncbi:circadian clock protein KaiB [Bradyrhizobium sp. WSM 1704]|uniref:circadian clock KaiB family protein n=1 Tax=Bradyrhizobium semiaridum TaxID=2821404 RepID=UPI001CE27888|nr:circadian clock KaiB family protein [Bradyrhizobium semiaridum]MCA6125777.1 circadian clock protein KaiB [Bradyrhizobium semiaridum]
MAELVLRLYIAGNSASSRLAEQNLSRMEASIKSEGWRVEIIDVLNEPELAEKAGVIATPTLSYEHPVRPRRIVGDLSDAKRVLDFLGIELKGDLHDRTG